MYTKSFSNVKLVATSDVLKKITVHVQFSLMHLRSTALRSSIQGGYMYRIIHEGLGIRMNAIILDILRRFPVWYTL